MKATYFLLLFLISSHNIAFPQKNSNDNYAETANKNYPVVGKPCPDFTLTDVHSYANRQLSLADLKGKHVILDFWADGCVSCIQSFPKLSDLQELYRDKLAIVIVGAESPNIRRIYDKVQKRYNLKLISAYDSVISRPPFKMEGGVPWSVWIDDKGIVKAVTYKITKDWVEKFMAGEPFNFEDVSYDFANRERKAYNNELPLFIDGNGGSNDTSFLFRSVLARWKPGMYVGENKMLYDHINPRFEMAGYPIAAFYCVAYAGSFGLPLDSFYWDPIIESKDSMVLNRSGRETADRYSYSLCVPKEKADMKYVMQIMQTDLRNYFGYEGKVEEREMPCLLLTVTDKRKFEKMKSSYNDTIALEAGADNIIALNRPVDLIANVLKGSTQAGVLKIFNETGYSGNLNLRINALTTDLDEIKKVINKQGLDIVYGKRKMNVLVIRDAQEKVKLQ